MKIGSAIFFLDNKSNITTTIQLLIKSSQGPDYVKAACMGCLYILIWKRNSVCLEVKFKLAG